MQFPVGTTFNKWVLFEETQKGKSVLVIRRWAILPDGEKKLERLPVKKYKSLRSNPEEIKSFVVRLNEKSREEQTKKAVIIKHAFISPKMLDSYKEFLVLQIPTKSKALAEYSYLETYFLNFFIGDMNISDPVEWHRIHKTAWASYLLSNDAPESAYTKKNIVSAANRFMQWLHELRPLEVPPLKFNPITKAKFREIEAKRELDGNIRKPKLIKDSDWKVIKLKASETLKPFLLIAYDYGLRRSEILGLKLEDIKNGYLFVKRQLDSLPDGEPKFIPLKGRSERRVPHWFGNTKTCHSYITHISVNRMHPDTLTDLWFRLMEELHLDYNLHDIRHTWITKAMRQQKVPRDVQLAAGHKSLKTTMGYLHDDRELEDEQYAPEGA